MINATKLILIDFYKIRKYQNKMSKQVAEEKVKTFLQYNTIELDPESFPEPEFEKKTPEPGIDSETGKPEKVIPYYSAPLIHRTRQPNGKMVTDQYFEVEGPRLISNGGLLIRKDKGKYAASILVSHSQDDKEVRAFCGDPIDGADFMKMPEEAATDDEGNKIPGRNSLGFWSQVYLRCLCYCFDKRDKIGIKGCKGIAGFEALFSNPLRWTTNPDGSIMEGRDPTKFYKVNLFGDPATTKRKASFAMAVEVSKEFPDGTMDLDWALLQNVRLDFKPLFIIKSIYAGGKGLSIQLSVKSAVVFGFTPIDMSCQQKTALSEQRKDGDLLKSLQEQLAKAREMIAANGGGIKLADPIKSKEEKEEEAKNASKPKKAVKKVDLDEEEEEEEKTTKTKKSVAGTLKKPPKKKVESGDEAEEVEAETKKTKKSAGKKKAKETAASGDEAEGELA